MKKFVLLIFVLLLTARANAKKEIAIKSDGFENENILAQNEANEQPLLEEHTHLKKPEKLKDIYKNFKSTYVGNGTSNEYKKRLRHYANSRVFNVSSDLKYINSKQTKITNPEFANVKVSLMSKSNKISHKHKNNTAIKTFNKYTARPNIIDYVDIKKYQYDIGGGVKMDLDILNDTVNVHLNGNNLFEIMQNYRLADNMEKGRGKKYEMVSKVLPLLILPFLIQSAIVPFLVTKLKLLLMKSILVGKLAIFLLIISAIKHGNKMVQSYEVAPSYWAGEPSRRSELALSASSAAYNGYKVEGKPTTWIN